MLVPLTITQSARPPSLCGRQNHPSAATSASWTAIRAIFVAYGRRGRTPAPGGRATLLLRAEGHRGAVGGGPILGCTDGDARAAAGRAELPAREVARLARVVDIRRPGQGFAD